MALIEGSCLCGGVRFEVDQPFEVLTACHCTNCKRISGGVGTTSGRSRTDAVRIVEGRELLTTYRPPEGTTKTFCSRCGSNLFGGGWPESEWSSVRLSAIDTPIAGTVERHTYVRSMASWETLPDDGTPRFEAGAT